MPRARVATSILGRAKEKARADGDEEAEADTVAVVHSGDQSSQQRSAKRKNMVVAGS